MADYRPAAPKIQEQDLEGKLAIVTYDFSFISRLGFYMLSYEMSWSLKKESASPDYRLIHLIVSLSLSLTPKAVIFLKPTNIPPSSESFTFSSLQSQGATKGIGRAIALDLATRGCSLLGTYTSPSSAHNFDTLRTTVHGLYNTNTPSTPSSPLLKGLAADITNPASIAPLLSAVRSADSSFPQNKIDILVLNAAYNTRPKVGAATTADIQLSLTANLHWPILLVEELVRAHLFNPNARIVVLSSDRVRSPTPGSSIFNATKAGLESLARSWAVELPLSFPGTTVNAVSVGLTDTPGLRAFPAEAVEALKKERLGKVRVGGGGEGQGRRENGVS
ncbi:hypothetical protein N0V83_006549 [Neocucurbitaria cava]|uniref:NAD(P)-binding protein n=1 Tax=Neocucurbitaria cava TaxID=798079 RepID=A0A9W9CLC6_9PLEO|nr:hypothetical protein N0V83_006549 [Neocucurbitaria cava]